MEHKNRIDPVNSKEMRISTHSLTEVRTVRSESESRDAVDVENDARLLIENRKRKRRTDEIAMQEEQMIVENHRGEDDGRTACSSRVPRRNQEMMLENQADEERTVRSSQMSRRKQLKKERKQDDALVYYQNILRTQTTKLISLENAISATLVANKKLKAERDELQRENAQLPLLANANVRLQRQFEKSLIALQAVKIACEDLNLSNIFLVEKCKELELAQTIAASTVQDQRMRAEGHIALERRLRQSLEDQKKNNPEMVRSLEADKKKLVAEIETEIQKADAEKKSLNSDIGSLQRDLDAARLAIQSGKTEYENKLAIALLEKENVEKKLVLVEGERNAESEALVRQRADVMELHSELATALTTTENLGKRLEQAESERGATRFELDIQKALVIHVKEKLEMKLEQADSERSATRLELDRQKALMTQENDIKLEMQKSHIGEKRKYEYFVSSIREEASKDKGKFAQAQEQLDKARADIGYLKVTLESLRNEQNQRETRQYDIRLIEEKAAEGERQLVQANSDFVHLQNSVREENNRLEKLKNEIRRIQEGAADYETELIEALSSVSQLNESFETEKNRLEKLKYDVISMREEAAEDKRRLMQAHENELGEARTELANQKLELKSSREANNRLESDLRVIQEEAAKDKRNLVRAHRNELDQAITSTVHVMEEKKRLEKDLSLIQKEAAQDNKKAFQAQKIELDEAKTELVDLRKELEISWEERNRLERMNYDAGLIQEEAAADKRKSVQAHEKELDELRRDVVCLNMELGSSRQKKKRQKMRKYDMSCIQVDAAEDKRQLVQEHNIELDDARRYIAQLEMEIGSVREKKQQLETVEYDVSHIQKKGADDKRMLQQKHENELDAARIGILELEVEIGSIRTTKTRLECDLSRIQEGAAEEKRRFVQEHQNELDEARKHILDLKLELDSMREEKSDLDSAHETTVRNLEAEKERSMCQICLESPKDSISFPCLHSQYCFSCLEKHRQRSNTCPSCRTPINGVICLSLLS